MTTEEKILAMLTQMQESQKQMWEAQGQMQKTQEQMQKAQEQMQADISGMKDDITSIKFRLDYDVDKRFDAVNEGIDSILAQLTPKSRVDELEADVVVLKTAAKMLTQEVAELKKAQ